LERRNRFSRLLSLSAFDHRGFHQDRLEPVINHNLFLGHVDDDYEVQVFGITSRFRY
jgi:hypothetical protein